MYPDPAFIQPPSCQYPTIILHTSLYSLSNSKLAPSNLHLTLVDCLQLDTIQIHRILTTSTQNSTNFCAAILTRLTSDLSEYEVVVVTGDQRGAGTDANVSLIIFGRSGQSSKKLLENGKKCFERNQTDIFNVKSPCVGPLSKIRFKSPQPDTGSC